MTLYRLSEGDSCVMSASCVISQITFETQMAAEEDTRLLVVRSGVFERIAASNLQVKVFMYELIIERFSEVMWAMQQILFMGFDKRLAFSFTTSTQGRQQRDEDDPRADSKADGLGAEVVSRMLKRFSDDGIVEFRRGVIFLKDIGRLKKIIM